MGKIRVLFAKTEAGMGHIVPLTSIKETFEKEHGDEFEIIFSNFFVDSNNKDLLRFNNLLINEVKKANKSHAYGFASTTLMNIAGTKLSSRFVMKWKERGVYKASLDYLESLKPDVVVSSHFSTNYYAEHMKNKPLTVVYSPDVQIIKLFSYKSDLTLTPVDCGYQRALKKRRFNVDNLKLVDTCIKNEAINNKLSKEEAAKELGIDSSKFTVVVADGGYGIGRALGILNECMKLNLDLNLIIVCGKNEEMYNQILKIKEQNKTNVKIYPVSFKNYSLNYIISADIFCGKAGANALAEAVFFGKPVIVTGCATQVELDNFKYYSQVVGCAVHVSKVKKIVEKILELKNNKTEFERMSNNALSIHKNFGSKKASDEIYRLIQEKLMQKNSK